jgi:hypothetical protein
MKICSVGAQLFHADRDAQTDGHYEANSLSSQFLRKTPKMQNRIKYHHLYLLRATICYTTQKIRFK